MKSGRRKVEVFMFIDALGWRIVNDYSFMEKELPYRSGVRMQFGYSSSAVPTILSGRKPDEHGHFSFFYLNKNDSPFRLFKLFRLIPGADRPEALWNRGRVRSIISKIVGRLKRYTGYFQLYNMPFSRLGIFDYCEKNDIFARKGLAPCENLADILSGSGISYHISDWRKSEGFNLNEAERLMSEGKTSFYFIYTAAMDSLLHARIDDKNAIAEKLDFYAGHIREMLATLSEKSDSFNFTVISDHGMTKLSAVSDVKGAVESLGLKFGSDYAACYDSTMFRVWFFNDRARRLITDKVNPSSFPGRYITEKEKRFYGIAFENNKFGDEIFLMDPGIQIVPSDMGLKPLNGMHGFLPEDMDSTASILSTSPFKTPEDVSGYFSIMKERIEPLEKD